MPEQPLLSPFPDELVLHPDKEKALRFVLGLPIPARYRRRHIARWAEYTGTTLTREERDRAAGVFTPPAG